MSTVDENNTGQQQQQQEHVSVIEQIRVKSRVPNTSIKEAFVTWLSWALIFFVLDEYYIPYWDDLLSTVLLLCFVWGFTTEMGANLSNVPTDKFSLFDWVAYIPFYIGLFIGSFFKKTSSPIPYVIWNPLYHGFALKLVGFFVMFAVGGVSIQYTSPPNTLEYSITLGVLSALMLMSMSTKHVWKVQERSKE